MRTASTRANISFADLQSIARSHRFSATDAVLFGLAAPLDFIFFANPSQIPSRWFLGTHESIPANLTARLTPANALDESVREALLANAQTMAFDHAPNEAILGMEFLAEEIGGWGELSDAEPIAAGIRRTILTEPRGGALGRGLYLEFLRDSEKNYAPAGELAHILEPVCGEWMRLADLMDSSYPVTDKFALASLQVRRIASREEFFWGRVLELTR